MQAEWLTTALLQTLVKDYQEQLCSGGLQRLGIYLDNGSEWIAWDLAAQEANISCIPLPKFFSDEQLRHCVHLAGIDAIITDEPAALRTKLPDFIAIPSSARNTTLLRHRTLTQSRPLTTPTSGSERGMTVSKVTFTSGSTGHPKGVMLTEPAITRVVDSLAGALRPVGMKRHLCLLPLPILLENIAGVYLPLACDGAIAAPTGKSLGLFGSSGLDHHKLAQALEHYQPDSLILLPQLLLALVVLAEQKKITASHFRFLAVGGAAVSPRLLERARRAGLPVYEGYGLSECASVVALNTPLADRIGSVGKILPHQNVNIEDGEIIVNGSGFSGYLSDTPDRHETADRVATGDEGYLDEDGYLYIRGRKKNIIVSSFGRNINPEWPESRLLELSCIRQAIVTGEGRPQLGAIIVCEATDRDTVEKHIRQINAEMPDYARIHHWQLISPAQFSEMNLLTANGRIKRHLVPTLFSTVIPKENVHEVL